MIDTEQNAYLADFGLAKVLGGSSQLTTTGSIICTPAYMSPEQLRGDPINHRSDIYSLGVILYHMLAGRPPFEALTTFSLIYQHVEKTPPPPREFNPQIPPDVELVILRAMQKNPDERFESSEYMTEALNIALGRKPGWTQACSNQRQIRSCCRHPPCHTGGGSILAPARSRRLLPA
jgi:serine/threonine-protein kinase